MPHYDEQVHAVEAMPAPPNMELEKEFDGRAEDAGRRATELESQARQWRAVERACKAGLKALGEEEGRG